MGAFPICLDVGYVEKETVFADPTAKIAILFSQLGQVFAGEICDKFGDCPKRHLAIIGVRIDGVVVWDSPSD